MNLKQISLIFILGSIVLNKPVWSVVDHPLSFNSQKADDPLVIHIQQKSQIQKDRHETSLNNMIQYLPSISATKSKNKDPTN